MTGDRFDILLVEDNSADVYLFRKALTGAGLNYELKVLEDGGAAMAFIRGEDKFAGSPVPDLVLLDVSLPKNDGLQVLEALRKYQRFADVPVIITSSSARPPAPFSESLRVTSYIMKPPDLEDFLQIGTAVKEILLDNQAGRAGQ
jgi:two-component system, chemotaxis family, response regulator Rcp1